MSITSLIIAEMSSSTVFGLALGVSNKPFNLEQPFSYSTAAAPPQVFRHRFCSPRPPALIETMFVATLAVLISFRHSPVILNPELADLRRMIFMLLGFSSEAAKAVEARKLSRRESCEGATTVPRATSSRG
jgi:hypothetical protein